MNSQSIFNFNVKDINGKNSSLSQFKNKNLIIVNTASGCKFTPQLKLLQKIHEENSDTCVLGFPCNQFGNQEPLEGSEIQEFCELNYKVSFPLFSKIDVNGKNEDPLFHFLKEKCPGLFGSKSIKWNFTKFLVNKEGIPVKRFSPTDSPKSIMKYLN